MELSQQPDERLTVPEEGSSVSQGLRIWATVQLLPGLQGPCTFQDVWPAPYRKPLQGISLSLSTASVHTILQATSGELQDLKTRAVWVLEFFLTGRMAFAQGCALLPADGKSSPDNTNPITA